MVGARVLFYCPSSASYQASLKAELALISNKPPTAKVTLPEYIRTQIWRWPQFFRLMEDNLIFKASKDDLNFVYKWKTTSIFNANGRWLKFCRKMEDGLNLLGNWNTTSNVFFLIHIKGNIICFCKWKKTIFFL